MNQRVLVFGTFDGFDEGHCLFISNASNYGTELVVAVSRDVHVKLLKNKVPKYNEKERCQRVSEDSHVSRVVLSDEILGSYRIIDVVRPDVIVLGFDQELLEKDLVRWMVNNDRKIDLVKLDYYNEHVSNLG